MITILTTGTRGDTQSNIALGLELKKTGHKVRVAAFENYKSYIRGFGFELHPIKGDVSKMAISDAVKDATKADNPLYVLLSFNKLKSFAYDFQSDFYEACVGSDAIVYYPGAPIGYFAAKYLKILSILRLHIYFTDAGQRFRIFSRTTGFLC